jgi:hypothetical protein
LQKLEQSMAGQVGVGGDGFSVQVRSEGARRRAVGGAREVEHLAGDLPLGDLQVGAVAAGVSGDEPSQDARGSIRAGQVVQVGDGRHRRAP